MGCLLFWSTAPLAQSLLEAATEADSGGLEMGISGEIASLPGGIPLASLARPATAVRTAQAAGCVAPQILTISPPAISDSMPIIRPPGVSDTVMVIRPRSCADLETQRRPLPRLRR